MACSGATYPTVPDPEACTVRRATLAMPKSVSRSRLPPKRMKFSGLMSQCITRLEWA